MISDTPKISLNSAKKHALHKNFNETNENEFVNHRTLKLFPLKKQQMDDDNDENFISLIELDLFELKNKKKQAETINSNNHVKEKKKTIQFNLDPAIKEKDESIKSPTFFDRRSSVHDKLNQLKVEAINKRRLNSERNDSIQEVEIEKLFDLTNLFINLKIIRLRLYYFLQRPTGLKGFAYRLFTFTIILCSIITGALTTLRSLDKWSFKALFWYEIFANLYFSIELALRCWSCTHMTKYSGLNGIRRFLSRPLIIIEMFVILASSFLLYFNSSFKEDKDGIFKPLTLLKFIQIFRFFYVDRKGQTWKLLLKVVLKHRFELLTSAYIGIIILFFSSYLILLVEQPYSEKNNDNHFHSYSDAVYWSIITMATIGYGDRSPRTFYGKLITTGLSIIGVAFWTLPSGIIGSGFALKVEEKNKKKQFNRLVPAAATLIQSWWRMKASLFLTSSNTSCLVATIKTFDISKPIISQSLRRLRKNIESMNSEEMLQYFHGLDKPMNKEKMPDIEEPTVVFRNLNNNDSKEEAMFTVIQEKNRLIDNESTLTKKDLKFVNTYFSAHSSAGRSSNENTSLLLQLSPEHLILIRTILLLKFLASKQQFKLAFKPYDFKDVIEQYTQGNMDVLLKMKDLQRKIEKVYESLPQNKYITRNDSYNSLSHALNSNQFRKPILMQNSAADNHIYDNSTLNGSIRRSRVTSSALDNKSFKTINSSVFFDVNEPENSLFDRLAGVEIKLDDLSKKFDKIIEIFNTKS